MYFLFHTLKNFTCLRLGSGIFNVESISDFHCTEINLKYYFMQLCRVSSGHFMYNSELVFPTSDGNGKMHQYKIDVSCIKKRMDGYLSLGPLP